MLSVIGLNHSTAPVELREKLVFDCTNLEGFFRSLNELGLVRELAVLCTCNRTEFYVVTGSTGSQFWPPKSETSEITATSLTWPPPGPTPAALERILELWATTSQVGLKQLTQHLYYGEQHQACCHLFRVASGLDSMLLGENQILGQVRKCFVQAQTAGWLGPLLNKLFPWALHLGKRVRCHTHISQGAANLSAAAIKLAQQRLGTFEGRRTLVIGSGKMGALALRHLASCRPGKLLVANRTLAAAQELARQCQATSLSLEAVPDQAPQCDLIISSVSAPEWVLTANQLGHRRHVLIDLAIPRTIAPTCAQLPGVELYNVDDLQSIVRRDMLNRQLQVGPAQQMIGIEVDRFANFARTRQAGPAIKALRAYGEQLRCQVLAHCPTSHLNARAKHKFENYTRTWVNRLLYRPIMELKKLSQNGASSQQLLLALQQSWDSMQRRASELGAYV